MRQSLSLSRGLSSWTTWTTGLFAFFFIFSALWLAEFFALPFRAQDQGRELAGATEFEPGHHRSAGGQGSAEISRAGAQEDWYWRHPFAPRGMLHRLRLVRHVLSREPQTCSFLARYASKFRTFEIDSTYYASPSAPTVIGWRDKTRDDFIFAVKIPQSITHDKVLVDCDTSFANSSRSWIFCVTSLGR